MTNGGRRESFYQRATTKASALYPVKKGTKTQYQTEKIWLNKKFLNIFGHKAEIISLLATWIKMRYFLVIIYGHMACIYITLLHHSLEIVQVWMAFVQDQGGVYMTNIILIILRRREPMSVNKCSGIWHDVIWLTCYLTRCYLAYMLFDTMLFGLHVIWHDVIWLTCYLTRCYLAYMLFDTMLFGLHVIWLTLYFRVERKERARLKNVKFQGKGAENGKVR